MIKIAAIEEIENLVNQYPGLSNIIYTGCDDFTLLYLTDEGVVAVLSASIREIPAPLNGEKECFINVIDVFDMCFHGKGIGSSLVQEAIKTATAKKILQVRAYCDITQLSHN